VPVLAVQLVDGPQRVHPLAASLADPDQDAGGEGDAQAPGFAEHRQPAGWPLVGRVVVRHARLAQSLACAFEHEAETDVDLLEAEHVLRRQQAGVGVWQKARGERRPRRPLEVLHRVGEAECRQLPPVRGERALGLVAQAKQRLGATLSAAAVEPLGDLVRGHGPGTRVTRGASERAVIAAVLAQVRERQEHLGRVGDAASPAPVAARGRVQQELVERTPGELERLLFVTRLHEVLPEGPCRLVERVL
jgi:hypothetical protein